MGGSSKKTTSNQTTSSSSTSTPTLPSWATDSLSGLNGRINALGQVDPASYVAPASTLQTQAYANAGNLGSNQGLFGQAAGMASGASTPITGNIDQYMSPYLKDVVSTSLADFDQGALQQQQALKAGAAGSGAFGDSTYGIAQGQLGADLARGRASTAAGLLNTGYNTALGAAQADASRKLSAAGLLGNLGTQEGDSARADATTQDQLGQDQRSIAQSQATAPISLAQTIASLLQSNQLGLLQGNSTTSNGTSSGTAKQTTDPGLLGTIGQAASTASSLAKLFA